MSVFVAFVIGLNWYIGIKLLLKRHIRLWFDLWPLKVSDSRLHLKFTNCLETSCGNLETFNKHMCVCVKFSNRFEPALWSMVQALSLLWDVYVQVGMIMMMMKSAIIVFTCPVWLLILKNRKTKIAMAYYYKWLKVALESPKNVIWASISKIRSR